MHYVVLTNIQVQQIPSDKYPDRNNLLTFKFLHSYEGESSWNNLTQTMKIVLPKKVKVPISKTAGNDFFKATPIVPPPSVLGNTTGAFANLGGFTAVPTLLRGDLIRFNIGYRAIVGGGEQTIWTGQDGTPNLFEGIISSVNPKLPFTIECEDFMWICKQIPTEAKQYKDKNLGAIVREVIDSAQDLDIVKRYKGYINLSVSDFSKTDLHFNVGNFTTTRGSLAMLLSRIKTQYNVDSFFRGQELRIGLLHYLPEETKTHTFTFQKNIIDDHLVWKRKDDIVMSALVKANYLKEGEGTTLDGQPKTVHACTEILIFESAGEFTYIEKKKGDDFSKQRNQIGENFHFNIYSGKTKDFDPTNPKDLFTFGKAQLEKRYYTGFRGSFTTFGFPYVKHGDTVRLINRELPEIGTADGEKEGYYKVKTVEYYGGFDDGLRQRITIDYRLPDNTTQ